MSLYDGNMLKIIPISWVMGDASSLGGTMDGSNRRPEIH